jgi:hypothetical protein
MIMNEAIMTFEDVLGTIAQQSSRAWVYLPDSHDWSLQSKAAILESEEVPSELEDEPDAGIPAFAKANNFIQVVPVTVLQDIVTNARTQKPDSSPAELFRAFQYYYKNDTFISFA